MLSMFCIAALLVAQAAGNEYGRQYSDDSSLGDDLQSAVQIVGVELWLYNMFGAGGITILVVVAAALAALIVLICCCWCCKCCCCAEKQYIQTQVMVIPGQSQHISMMPTQGYVQNLPGQGYAENASYPPAYVSEDMDAPLLSAE